MDSTAEFVTRTHTRGSAPLPSKRIGRKDAQDIAATIDWNVMRQIAEDAQEYMTEVMAEMNSLFIAHGRQPERMKRRAFFFGISTPHRDESQAIAWAKEAEALFDQLTPDELAHHQYASPVHGRPVNLGTYTAIARAISSGKSRNVWHGDLAALEATPGVGPKVARMIQAVLDPYANSWTVDLWHARQLLHASGRDYCVAASVSKPGYAILEGVWLSYKAKFFPHTPTWAVQWATWCAAEGKFVSHESLWADLAS